jgi:hypothetical protein
MELLENTWQSLAQLPVKYNHACVLAVSYLAYRTFKSTVGYVLKKLAEPGKADSPLDPKYDRNKIYFHMFPRKVMAGLPNGSPFVMKLETWMRMMDIQHEVGHFI